jgi:hypothetical protein
VERSTYGARSQGNWNLALRDMERDILPMARAFGMAIGTSRLANLDFFSLLLPGGAPPLER